MSATASAERTRRRSEPGAARRASIRSTSRAEDERYPLSRLVSGRTPLDILARAGPATRSEAMLAAQRWAGNSAVQRMIAAAATPVQREDEPSPAPVVADKVPTLPIPDKIPKLTIPFGTLGSKGIKPLALKPWTERDLTPEGATVTAGVQLEDFWSGQLFKLPAVLNGLRFLPKIGAGVEVKQYDWGTGAVRPKVGAQLIDIGLPKLFKGVNVVGEISATAKSVTPSAGVEWSKENVTVSLKGEVEGEVGRVDPATYKSQWEWTPKATLKIEYKF